MSEHSKVIEFGSKANADSYIAAGWELIETRAEPFVLGITIIVYFVGWTLASRLCHPPTTICAIWKKDLQQIGETARIKPA